MKYEVEKRLSALEQAGARWANAAVNSAAGATLKADLEDWEETEEEGAAYRDFIFAIRDAVLAVIAEPEQGDLRERITCWPVQEEE